MGPARLSALDAAFLSLQSPDAPMHVGWAAVLAPPDERWGNRIAFVLLPQLSNLTISNIPRPQVAHAHAALAGDAERIAAAIGTEIDELLVRATA
ncbi:MAG TPA: wax ester/triacylglycerol synthase domain-containing protein [Solirubrobacteraceae bacterium]|nr:wax ester/triacylglycerol synthase domain-containing protein [Solirubrobacteraceae bacterium]